MQIKIEINRKDFLSFQKYVYFRTRLRNSFIIASIFVIIWLFIINFNKPFDLLLLLVEAFIFYVAWAILVFIIYKLNFIKIRKLPDEQGSILGEKTYIILEDRLREITEHGESIIKWRGIKRIAETKDYIYVFVDKIAAYILPKRCFHPEDNKDDFLLTLKTKVSEASQKK